MSDLIAGVLLLLLGLLPNFGLKETAVNQIENSFYKEKTTELGTKYDKVPEKTKDFVPTQINSDAGIFLDTKSGKILLAKDKDTRLPMASTTKMMTAILAVKNLELERIVTVTSLQTRPLDTTMGLSVGDRISVLELLHGLLITSGSDASTVLAKEVAGSEEQFVALMNEEASYLGLKNTQFTNSVGYDNPNHYSTAYDLAKLGKVFMLNKTLVDIVAKSSYTATSESGEKYLLTNTNKLLNGSTYRGIKTGTTYGAGECLVSLYENGDQKIIGVLLNSPARFSETTGIIEWTKHNFLW